MCGIKQIEWSEINLIPLSNCDMLVIVGQVILALRHPENSGPSTEIARKLIRDMAARLLERFGDDMPGEVVSEWRKEGIL